MRPSPFVFTGAEECLWSLSQRVFLRHPLLLKSILCVFVLECGGLDPDEEGQSEQGCNISPNVLLLL